MKQEMVQSRNRLLKSSNSLFRGHLQNGKMLSRIMTESVKGVEGKQGKKVDLPCIYLSNVALHFIFI